LSPSAITPRFANSTNDANNDYLSDGLTESLISSLSQLPNLKVMARSTVFRYKGKEDDPQQIGRALQVDAVLTGRILQHGNHVAVETDLVNTADGTELWGSHYDRSMADITQVQGEITRDISSKLRIQLNGSEQQRLQKGGTNNPEAYRLYLEGRQAWYGRTNEGLKQSIALFQQAISADPNYALAYAGLAETYIVAPGYDTGIKSKQGTLLADEAARKAIELDASLPEAHAAHAAALAQALKWSEAESEFRRAIDLNPNNADAHYFYAFICLIPLKRIDEALQQYQAALTLDPLSSIINTNYALGLMQAHRYPESLAEFQKVLARDPNFGPAHYRFSQLYATTGRFADAIAELKKAVSKPGSWSADAKGYFELTKVFLGFAGDPDAGDDASAIAVPAAIAGNRDLTFEYLEKAYAAGDTELPDVIRCPAFDPLRSDPRYASLMRRLGLPE